MKIILIIRDANLDLLAIIDNLIEPNIHEAINKEFDFTFKTVIDDDKSQYITHSNIAEIEDNYFNIVYHKRQRTQNGELLIDVECEHVSYDLIKQSHEYFTVDGTPTEVLSALLNGTNFTVGQVDFTDTVTFSINEPMTKRAILILFANYLGAELRFDKYEVSLLTGRGADNGIQYRVGKNIKGITKHVDNRSGTLKTAYDIDVVELDALPEYQGLEKFELGDTVQIIDTDIGVNESQRIVQYDYNPIIKMNSNVVIANFIEGLEDRITSIRRETIHKSKLYNGIRISTEDGFEAIRSDNKAKTLMSATEGISIYSDVGAGMSRNFYVDIDGKIIAKELDIDGSGTFSGSLSAATGTFTGALQGGTIEIGSGNSVFKADGNGIYLGDSTFTNAPFHVGLDGIMTATGANISGDITMTGGSITWENINSDPDIQAIANGAYSGGTFIDEDEIFAPNITGGVLTGALIQTAQSGNYPRIELSSSSNILTAEASSGKSIEIDTLGYMGLPALRFRDEGFSSIMYQDGETLNIGGSTLIYMEADELRVGNTFVVNQIGSLESQSNINTADITNLESRMNSAEDDINDLQSDVNDKVGAGTGGSKTLNYINASDIGLVVWFTDGSNETILYD